VKMQQIDGNSKSRVGKRRGAAAQKWGKIILEYDHVEDR